MRTLLLALVYLALLIGLASFWPHWRETCEPEGRVCSVLH